MAEDSFRDDPASWVEKRFRYAVTLEGDPGQQMFYSLFLALFAWFASAVTFGQTLFLVGLFMLTFFIGLARYIYDIVG